jgi:Na+-transporting NADH:ubiquinone oxidoreductase subunit NqrF
MKVIVDWKEFNLKEVVEDKDINSNAIYHLVVYPLENKNWLCMKFFDIDDVRIYEKEKFEILQQIIKDKQKLIRDYDDRINKLKNTFKKITKENFKQIFGDWEQ